MKLLATDLDGTLFYPKDKKNIISSKNLKVVRDFIDAGNEVAIVTGRSLSYCNLVEKKINRPVTKICFNGALVCKGDEIRTSRSIPNQMCKDLIDKFYKDFHLKGVFIMTKEGVFVSMKKDNPILIQVCKIYYSTQKNLAESASFSKKQYDEQLNNSDIYKIMFFFGVTPRAKKKASEANKLLRNILDDFECSWSSNVVEITAKDCHKANGILDYIATTNINHDDVYVVGDSGNDISNFKEFYEHSFCMGHASKSIRRYAKYIIDKFSDLTRYIY